MVTVLPFSWERCISWCWRIVWGWFRRRWDWWIWFGGHGCTRRTVIGDCLVHPRFLLRFVTRERSRVSAVHHCSDLVEVLRCLRASLQAGVVDGRGNQTVEEVFDFHQTFVSPQTQDPVQSRVRIPVARVWTLYATPTYPSRTPAAVDILSSRTVAGRSCAYIWTSLFYLHVDTAFLLVLKRSQWTAAGRFFSCCTTAAIIYHL